jgi:hypothetical protein
MSCNDNKKAIQSSLKQAHELYEQTQYGSAKQILDDLKAQYPKEFDAQKEALHLMRMIEWKEQERNLRFCDSLIVIRQAEADSLKPFFVFEKTEYDEIGRYVDKTWNPSVNAPANYIKTHVSESGEIVLTSVHSSFSSIQYDRLRVSIPSGEYTETETIPFDGGANYSFQDGNGTVYQIVTYQKGRDNGVIQFIYNHPREKLTASYIGKRTYSYVLTPPMIKALVRSADLSVVLSEIQKLQKEREKAAKRIEYLQSKIQVE